MDTQTTAAALDRMSPTPSRGIPSAAVQLKPLAVKPRIACLLLGCGRSKLYQLLNAGELRSYRDGGSRKILTESLEQYVARHIAAASVADAA